MTTAASASAGRRAGEATTGEVTGERYEELLWIVKLQQYSVAEVETSGWSCIHVMQLAV